ncbi:hypothetical protein BDV95DRAFT_610602 [Massariosphaeria phaeospora]|uniref:Uncharacterized protein n=1 Tax=Massariosphaeria phaeospora TaxID=100035 RepID=A0A7C8I0S6_9PLEO|nr:hypothetical protein BDV95DRAFT_610602 [Massariosphaeria phaeospora]
MDSTSTQPSAPSLMRLPVELRLMVYEHLDSIDEGGNFDVCSQHGMDLVNLARSSQFFTADIQNLLQGTRLQFSTPLGPNVTADSASQAHFVRKMYGSHPRAICIDVPLIVSCPAKAYEELYRAWKLHWIHPATEFFRHEPRGKGKFCCSPRRSSMKPTLIKPHVFCRFMPEKIERGHWGQSPWLHVPYHHMYMFMWWRYCGLASCTDLTINVEGLQHVEEYPQTTIERTSRLLPLAALLASIIAFSPQTEAIRMVGLGTCDHTLKDLLVTSVNQRALETTMLFRQVLLWPYPQHLDFFEEVVEERIFFYADREGIRLGAPEDPFDWEKQVKEAETAYKWVFEA